MKEQIDRIKTAAFDNLKPENIDDKYYELVLKIIEGTDKLMMRKGTP